MNKSQKLAQKIEALRAELSAVRVAETEAAQATARRQIDRAIRASGLLPLLAAGALSAETIEAEFRTLVARAKSPPGEMANHTESDAHA